MGMASRVAGKALGTFGIFSRDNFMIHPFASLLPHDHADINALLFTCPPVSENALGALYIALPSPSP